MDELYDASRCPSVVSVRAQNLHAAFLRPQVRVRVRVRVRVSPNPNPNPKTEGVAAGEEEGELLLGLAEPARDKRLHRRVHEGQPRLQCAG